MSLISTREPEKCITTDPQEHSHHYKQSYGHQHTHTAPDPAISSLSILASEQTSGPSSSNTPIRQPMTYARVPVPEQNPHCTSNRRPELFPHHVPANQTRHARPTRADIHNHTGNNITNGQLQRSNVGASDSNAKAVGERAVSFSMKREIQKYR